MFSVFYIFLGLGAVLVGGERMLKECFVSFSIYSSFDPGFGPSTLPKVFESPGFSFCEELSIDCLIGDKWIEAEVLIPPLSSISLFFTT